MFLSIHANAVAPIEEMNTEMLRFSLLTLG